MKQKYETRGQRSHLADIVREEVDSRLDNAIKQFNDQETRHLKIVRLEHSFLFSEGYAIPSPECLTSRNWLEAMTMSSMEERLLYYCELGKVSNKQTQKPGGEENQVPSQSDLDGENKHSIFLSLLTPEQEERLTNHRLSCAMLHGSVLAIDMGFDEKHLSTEIYPLVDQLWRLYLVNGASQEPFHLIFTNCNFSGPTYRHLLLSCMVRVNFVMATFTEQSHADIFPLQTLVYLSSQSKETLTAFNADNLYVLGAYYDPLVRKKLSYAKAKQQNIRCLKLPIDQHVKWAHQAHKDLDLDSVCGILLSVRCDGLWKKAFLSVVPHLVNQNS
ncbi:mitochondrial ribonuclease p protein 1 homolog [Plakobranchus ocellatus]|uniref:RNA (guanine-9-)-methyltransferase domain-containing protein 1 n=1 Tax=Plakobranchus ocellatus TaxID=259542 RepID=A0AAV4B9L1_9GAST|nr:mitochondrial ribonuclease p protein 1 homolog [Plakobranchus ocellatus]